MHDKDYIWVSFEIDWTHFLFPLYCYLSSLFIDLAIHTAQKLFIIKYLSIEDLIPNIVSRYL